MHTPLDPAGPDGRPECVIVIPALNEAATIRAAVRDLLTDGTDWPILVLDGGSTDGTRNLVRDIAATQPRVQLVDNPGVNQAAAVNRGARLALAMGARVMFRADAHARYPRGFTRGLLLTIDAEKCDTVVTPLIAQPPPEGSGPWERASAALQSTWLGTGGAPHRHNRGSGPIDHGHHAAFRVRAFLSIGGYDETFAANEDAEFDLRLTEAGGRIYLQTQWPVGYVPRTKPGSLFRQYWRNGRWRMMTAQKHAQLLGLRQFLPIGAVTVVIAALIGGLVIDPRIAAPAGGYLFALLWLASRCGANPGQVLRVMTLAMAMHFGFGLGALASLVTPPARPMNRGAELA